MIDAGGECKFGRFEGVVCRKVDVEEEDSSLIGRLSGAQDGGLPVEGIISDWSCRALSWGVVADVLQLLVNPLQCHYIMT